MTFLRDALPYLLISVLLLLAGVLFSLIEADNAALTWDNPTLNEDGSTLDDLAGLKVYRDQSDCNNPQLIATLGVVESYADIDVPSGTNCYVVAAFDTSGNESAYSNKAYKVVDLLAPAAPDNLEIN